MFLLGTAGPRLESRSASDYFFHVFSRALFYSWVFVFLIYLLDLDIDRFLLYVMVLSSILLYRVNAIITFKVNRSSAIVALGLFLVPLFYYLAQANFPVLRYDLVFVRSVAVVSWNRWAMELFQNEYRPLNSAYPILFPGLWSLIYKSQVTSEIWIFTKLTMVILLFFQVLYLCIKFVEGHILNSLIVVLLSVFLFNRSRIICCCFVSSILFYLLYLKSFPALK